MITELEPIEDPDLGPPTWGDEAAGHPMREVARAVAFDPEAWDQGMRGRVAAFFDAAAPGWNARGVAGRELPIFDALDRGLPLAPNGPRRVAMELGGGTGLYAEALASRFATLVTLDLSAEMLVRVPAGQALAVQGDGSNLPFADRSFDVLVLVNMFLFPAEVDRVLAGRGVLVWVSSRGPGTPIHLSASDVDRALPGPWSAVAARAGWGTWSVHWRDVAAG